ncbi:MAG: insulinase family protein [Chloroflexi bacterium]|nr:MAG: insulinase family protein [Chloroflexota bacterium]
MTHPITPENVTRAELSNGITVLVKENHTNASISLRGRLRAGGMYETDATAGLASFTASSLQRGTRKYTFQKLNELYDNAGMSFSAAAGTETASFGGKALTEDFEALLEIAGQVLLQPIFPSAEIEKLRGQIITNLREAQDDTRYVAWTTFERLAFPPGHPYHRSSDGDEATVKKLTRAKLAEFHAKYFRPEGAIFVIVGDIEAQKAIELVANHFGGWKGKKNVPFLIPDAPFAARALRRDLPLPGKIQADVVLGYPGVKRNDRAFYALRTADLIFGQLGLSGRLGEIVRDQLGLCYYVYSTLNAGIGAGAWMIGTGVNPRNVDAAIEAIGNQARRLRAEGVTADELAHAQDYLTGSLALRLETNDGVAATLADMELYSLGMDYIVRYADLFRSVTRAQILEAVEQYARWEDAVIVTAGPAMD